MRHEVNRIQSKNHNVGSSRINEISLSSYDDKKYILEDGYSRLSHFHKSNKKSHKKYFLSNIYRQFVLIFTLVSITNLFNFFFRAIIFFFSVI